MAALSYRYNRLRRLLENPLHDARTDAELAADLENAIAGSLQFENLRFYCGLNATPAELGPICTRARQARIDSLSLMMPRSNSANTPNI